MIESIQPKLTWSQDCIFAGGERSVVLLVEWRGNATGEQIRQKSHKVVAREIELRVWLEPHVTFKHSYGYEAEAGEGGSLIFKLGKIRALQRKFFGLEFIVSAPLAGKYEALWVQWSYKRPSVERIRELPVTMLNLEYTHHTRIMNDSSCFHVEKHLEMLKTAEILKEVTAMRMKGQHNQAIEKLTRQADKLLLLTTRSGDMLLLKEAETLYKQIELERRSPNKTAL